ETGRTLNREQSVTDAMLIKEMNMNAVRSHYPPDRHFLDGIADFGTCQKFFRYLPIFYAKYLNKPSKRHIYIIVFGDYIIRHFAKINRLIGKARHKRNYSPSCRPNMFRFCVRKTLVKIRFIIAFQSPARYVADRPIVNL
ncbi:MAG: hypothetical protein K2J13_00735, partial [Clostridia bacterium]|nr:hypothetical protein [Clostridia bacterium]